MSSRSVVTVVTAALLLGVWTGSASAAEPYEPVFNTERVYVHCNGQDVQHWTQLLADIPTRFVWDTTAPTSSAGCGQIDEARPGPGGKLVGAPIIYEGTHTGNLDRLTVHAWVRLDNFLGGSENSLRLDTEGAVTVDGTTRSFGADLRAPRLVGRNLLEFSVVGLGLLDDNEAGVHDVQIALDYEKSLHNCVPECDPAVDWRLDDTEASSGVTFSPASLAEKVIDVTP